MTSEAAIVGIGQSLGRGTIISMFLVLFVLPQILLLGGGLADKTSFSVAAPRKQETGRGRYFVDGMVTGEVHGRISGQIRASIEGDVDLRLISGSSAAETETGGNSHEES